MRHRSSFAQALDAADRAHVPIEAALELTHRCSLRCRHCFLDHGSDRQPVRTARWLELVDELADAGTLFLCLTGGDPLLHPDWLEIAQHARQRRFAIRVFTNATSVSRETACHLAALHARVEVSVLSLRPEVHDHLSGVSAQLEAVRSGLAHLADAGLRLRIKMPVVRANLDELEAIAALADQLGAELSADARIIPLRSGGLSPLAQRLTDAELDRFLDTPWGAQEPRDHVAPSPDAEPCGAGRRFCTVTAHGDVLACMALPEVAGSILEASFADIWESSPWLNRLRRLRLRDLHDCASCPDLVRCGRCPGQALSEDGDLLGPASWSCRHAALLRLRRTRSA